MKWNEMKWIVYTCTCSLIWYIILISKFSSIWIWKKYKVYIIMYKPYCNDSRLYFKFLAKYKNANETMKDMKFMALSRGIGLFVCYIYDVNTPDTLTIGGVRKNTIRTRIYLGILWLLIYCTLGIRGWLIIISPSILDFVCLIKQNSQTCH